MSGTGHRESRPAEAENGAGTTVIRRARAVLSFIGPGIEG
jgi:hypothetical protein